MQNYQHTKLLPFIIYRNIQAFLFPCAFRAYGKDAILSLHSGACHGGVGREEIVFARAIQCASCLNICIHAPMGDTFALIPHTSCTCVWIGFTSSTRFSLSLLQEPNVMPKAVIAAIIIKLDFIIVRFKLINWFSHQMNWMNPIFL